jgi:hypothetical protein
VAASVQARCAAPRPAPVQGLRRVTRRLRRDARRA